MYLYNVNNRDSLLWSYQTNSNCDITNNSGYIIRVNSASNILNAFIVNSDSLYLYTGTSGEDNYKNYTKVKCVEFDFYLYGTLLTPICKRKYADANDKRYKVSNSAKGLITPDEYAKIKDKNILSEQHKLEIKKISEHNELQLKKMEGQNVYTLKKVEVAKNKFTIVGKISKSEMQYTKGDFYTDNLLNVLWTYTPKQIQFKLTNTLPNSIQINWNEAAIVVNGISDRVAHKGVRVIDRNNYQPNSIIPSKASLSDLISPVSGFYYSGGWKQLNIIESKAKESKIMILLPVYVDGVKIEYKFIFNVNWEYKYPELRDKE